MESAEPEGFFATGQVKKNCIGKVQANFEILI